MNGRWPLHPEPRAYETLRPWVERIAAGYNVSFSTFNKVALGISQEDLGRVWSGRVPPPSALARLSAGTGIAVADLESMELSRVLARCLDEVNRMIETEDGRAELAKWAGPLSPVPS